MAVDEVLLETAGAGGGLCWRFYAWNEPVLSLGYFQDHDDRAASIRPADVARPSGGSPAAARSYTTPN